jgi:hypothetical protein
MSDTATPDLLTALKRLAKHTNKVVHWSERDTYVDVFGDVKFLRVKKRNIEDEFTLAQLEHLLVKLAEEWEVSVQRRNYASFKPFVKLFCDDDWKCGFIIGNDGITSIAHALAVGLLNFKEEKV